MSRRRNLFIIDKIEAYWGQPMGGGAERPPRGFGTCVLNHRGSETIHDTACITYRCFLPDLTRFVTVCCVATGRIDPGHTSQNPGMGALRADDGSGKPRGATRHPYAYSIRPKIFFSRKKRMVIIKPAIDMATHGEAQAKRGARRGAPQPPFNEPAHGSQLAPYLPGQPRRTDPHGAAGRLCLPAVSLRRLGGVAASPEKLVAARRGGHPAPPVRGMLEFAISIDGVIKTRLPVDL